MQSHFVRIIAGSLRGSKLEVPSHPGLRPTSDRLRVTLFNWLGMDFNSWVCCDAFAGSGALGFEAASRNAAQVYLWDKDAGVCKSLQSSALRLRAASVHVQRIDAMLGLPRLSPESLDLVFLDPPFALDLALPALHAARAALKPGAYAYLESPRAFDAQKIQERGWVLHRYTQVGAAHAYLLIKSTE